MKYEILKCHANGNSFILIDEEKESKFNDELRVTLSKLLTNKESGIGSDGLLFYQSSLKHDAKMRMFNPDGSEAEMCGNGLRCLARYAIEKQKKDLVFIETKLGFEKVCKHEFENTNLYEITFKNISLNNNSMLNIQLSSFPDMEFSKAFMPNPHIVTITDNFSLLEKVGYEANLDLKKFPNGINVNFIKILNKNLLYIQTYERGVGVTLSCGSGNSASSLIACLLEVCDFDKDITIYNDGGIIKCHVSKEENNYIVAISGIVTYEFKALVELEDNNDIKISKLEEYISEIKSYESSLLYKNSLIKEYNI